MQLNFSESVFVSSLVFVMAALREQRASVKFCILIVKMQLKTAYKVNALGKTRVYEFDYLVSKKAK